MKTKNVLFACCVLMVSSLFSQNVGINTETPTEILDVNGGIRLRTIPQDDQVQYIMSINDTGKVYKYSYESLRDSLSMSSRVNTITLVSGDTIVAGDCIAIGDGVSGVYSISTTGFPLGLDPMTNSRWLAQTFITGPKVVAIKSVIFSLSANATTPANTITCSIKNVVGGIPSGPDVGGQVATLDGPLGNAGYYTIGRMVFNPPLIISPNTNYAIVFRTSLSNTNLQLEKQNLGSYANGYAVVSFNAGTTWQIQPTFDFNLDFYFCETRPGQAYRSRSVSGGIGWNTINSCLEANGCPSGFFDKNDRYDNVVGIALNDALPGQAVQVQVNGFTDLVSSFPLGRKLFLGSPPGKLATSGVKSVGISTGNGMIIQVTY